MARLSSACCSPPTSGAEPVNPRTQRQSVAGPDGALECAVDAPPEGSALRGVAVICHPHPQHGGTMDNKVVQTLARAFIQLGWRAVRFNFRGIGKSDDVLAVRTLSGLERRPVVVEGCELHADRQRILYDVRQARVFPGTRQFTGAAQGPGVRRRPGPVPVRIEHGRRVVDHAQGDEPAACVPGGCGDGSAGTRHAAHFAHGKIGLRDKLQHQHGGGVVEGGV